MRKLFGILAAAALVFGATSASAAPVFTNATLSVSIQGLAPITITGAGTVDVGTDSTVTVGASLVTLASTIVIPVTGSTAIAQVKAIGIANQTGTFSLGGAPLTEVCASASPGEGCVSGTGRGGAMGLTGTVFVSIIPGIVVVPVNLNVAGIGQGVETNSPFTFDNGVFTTGQAYVRTDNATVGSLQFTATGASGPALTLVTGTYLSALGNILPVTTTLTLLDIDKSSIPEPGTLLLLASGVAGLVVVGRRRR